MVVFFKQLLLHLIIADKLLFIGNLLLCLILVHHLATKLSLTHRALLYHQIHLLFDLFLDASLECLEQFGASNFLLVLVVVLLALFIILAGECSVQALSVLSYEQK